MLRECANKWIKLFMTCEYMKRVYRHVDCKLDRSVNGNAKRIGTSTVSWIEVSIGMQKGSTSLQKQKGPKKNTRLKSVGGNW